MRQGQTEERSDERCSIVGCAVMGWGEMGYLCTFWFLYTMEHRDFRSWVDEVIAADTFPFGSSSMIARFYIGYIQYSYIDGGLKVVLIRRGGWDMLYLGQLLLH